MLAEIGPGGGNDDVFVIDLRNGTLNQVTFDAHSGSGHWLPDGRTIVWSTTDETSGGETILSAVS